MSFKDKYTTDKTSTDPKKQIVSTDAYAIGEMLEQLTDMIRMGK